MVRNDCDGTVRPFIVDNTECGTNTCVYASWSGCRSACVGGAERPPLQGGCWLPHQHDVHHRMPSPSLSPCLQTGSSLSACAVDEIVNREDIMKEHTLNRMYCTLNREYSNPDLTLALIIRRGPLPLKGQQEGVGISKRGTPSSRCASLCAPEARIFT